MRSLAILTAADCNLRCRYCPRSRAAIQRLRWADCRAAIDWALAVSGPELELVFTGGEPLLAERTLRRAVRYAEAANEGRRRLSFVLQTNGTLLGPRQLDFLAAHEFEVRVSFDGVPAAQRARGRHTSPLVHAILVSAISREKWRQGLAVTLTVTPDNIGFLAASVGELLELGAPRVYLSPCLTAGERRFAEWRSIMEEQFRQLHRLSLLHFGRYGDVPLRLFRWSGVSPDWPAQGEPPCAACSGASASLDVTGDLYRCALFASSAAGASPAWQAMSRRMRLGPPVLGWPGGAPVTAEDVDGSDPWRRRSSRGRCAECPFFAECRVCPFVTTLIGRGRGDKTRVPDFLCAFNLAAQGWKHRFPALGDRPPDAVTPALLPRQLRAWRDSVGALMADTATARRPPSRRCRRPPGRQRRPMPPP